MQFNSKAIEYISVHLILAPQFGFNLDFSRKLIFHCASNFFFWCISILCWDRNYTKLKARRVQTEITHIDKQIFEESIFLQHGCALSIQTFFNISFLDQHFIAHSFHIALQERANLRQNAWYRLNSHKKIARPHYLQLRA